MSESAHPREEVEEAFKQWATMGLLNENWVEWANLYTDDAVYVDHYWGTFRGPEEIARWNDIVCAACPQNYDIPIWYMIDGDRLMMRGQITADNPEPGAPPFTQTIMQYLEYGGNGKWKREEDFWMLDHARVFARDYEAARLKFDPDHPQKMTRLEWQNTPIDWARPDPSFQVRPSWVGRAEIMPIATRKNLGMGERHPV